MHGSTVLPKLPVAPADNQTQVTEQPQLMRDGRLFHADRLGELADRARTGVQLAEDADTARRRQRLHGVCHEPRERGIQAVTRDGVGAMGHRSTIAEGVLTCS